MNKKTEPLLFELRYRRECYRVEGTRFVRDEEREKTTTAEPSWFKPLRGTYTKVSNEANRLNKAQERSGFIDYLYFPEVATEETIA